MTTAQAGRPAAGGRERGDVLGDGGPDLVGDRAALEQPSARRRASIRLAAGDGDRLARLAAADGLAGLRREALDLVRRSSYDAAVISPSNRGRRPMAG